MINFIPLPTLRSFLKDEKITRAEAKAKFAQAREWDNNVVWGWDNNVVWGDEEL